MVCMISSSQIQGAGIEESYPLIMKLRSLGLVDPSSLTVDDSTGRHKLRHAISKNPDFSSSVISFLNHVVIMPLRSLNATKCGIEKVRTSLDIVREKATKKNKNKKKNGRKPNKKYMEVVAKLRAEWELLAVASPNTQELRSACEQQLVLLEKLSRRKQNLGKNLRRAKKWRKAWNVIYTMSYIVAIAGSVVLAALGAPPAATAATTAASNTIKLAETWFNSLWDVHESTLKAEMEAVAAMEKSRFLVHEFMSILSLMEMVEIDVGSMPGKEKEVVDAVATFGIGNIKNKIGVIEKSLDGLEEKVDWCISEIRKVAADFLKIITEII
ncbi:UPF0496 protein 1-like [Phoenix dactylifera]|uniref:UPF0496 protein 1-like n=1 Tax=Phoenix dactylifera TaxID=42345 RepID=A0A8B9AT91_PHODC|nr:UPF0496 protein 1-like [Phoenix dactylifera]